MSKGEPDLLVEIDLLQKERDDIELRTGEIDRRIEELLRERKALKKQYFWINKQIARIKLYAGTVQTPWDRRPTRRNVNLLWAWAVIHDKLAEKEDEDGVHQGDLRIAVKRVLPELKDATFRSYLHRFRKDGVIEKRSSGKWMLTTDRDEQGGAV